MCVSPTEPNVSVPFASFQGSWSPFRIAVRHTAANAMRFTVNPLSNTMIIIYILLVRSSQIVRAI